MRFKVTAEIDGKPHLVNSIELDREGNVTSLKTFPEHEFRPLYHLVGDALKGVKLFISKAKSDNASKML